MQIGRIACSLGLAVYVGCGCNTQARDRPAAELASKPPAAPQPSNEAEFLAELIPLPDNADAIEVSYAVTGPALEGELTILIAKGGNKREQWELRTTGANSQLRTAGSAIVNADQMWNAPEGEPGEVRVNQLGGLARAWASLDADKRAAVVDAHRDWRKLLDKRRAEVPGDQSEILGVACLQTRIAAQNLCMWEEAGLFLRYEGSAFTIEATQIDRDPTIAPDAFVLPSFVLPPPASGAAQRVSETVDFEIALDQAAEGNFAALFLLVSRARALPKLLAEPS